MGARPWPREARPALVVLAGWIVALLYAFPGVMTMDSFDQLREGREWSFTDAHPPAMASLWGVIDRILPGPLGMLVIQTGTFAAGLYLILRRAMRPMRAAVCTVALLLFPPVLAPMAVIWKDCQMAGFLTIGIAALLDERRGVRLGGLAALSIATAMRYMALAATFPIIVLMFEWEPGMRAVKRYAIAAAAWLAVTGVAMSANKLLTDHEMHLWHSTLAFQDIVGVLQFIDEDLPDSELGPLLEPTGIRVHERYHAALRAKYRSEDFQQLVLGEGAPWSVDWTIPLPETQREAIAHAWSTLVFGHLGAYARYRLENFGEALGVNRRFAGATVIRHSAQYPGMLEYMGVGSGVSRLQEIGEDIAMWMAKRTRLFRPHVYALLALALMALACAIDRRRVVFALLASGLLLELSMLVLTATPDYRYSHWLVVMTCLTLVLMFARRARVESAS